MLATRMRQAAGGTAVPAAPINLVATQNGANVDLTWTDNATNETEYRIYRSDDGVGYTLIDTIAPDSVAYTDTAPGSGVWYYEVAAANAAGEGLSDAASVVVYLLLDRFTSADPAPLTNPRTCEPGPGALTPTETDGSFAIAGGKLVFAAQTTPSWSDLALVGGAITRATGVALYAKITPNVLGQVLFGWCTATTGVHTNFNCALRFATTNIQNVAQATFSTVEVNAGVEYEICIILRSIGNLLFINGGDFTEWALIGVTNIANTATLYPRFLNYDSTGTMDDLIVVSLSSPFNADYGYATQRLAGARSASDTIVHTADFWGEFTAVTLPSAGELDFRFRQQDATNYWQVTISITGAVTLNEVVGGSVTGRGTSAGVIANGDRIVISAVGQTIRVFEGPANTGGLTVRITYASAANYITETDGVLAGLGTGGAISDIVTYPRVASGGALDMLNAVNPT